MGAGVDPKVLRRHQLRLQRKHGYPFVVLRASNGECAILPACRECGQATSERPEAIGKQPAHMGCVGFRKHIEAGGTLD